MRDVDIRHALDGALRADHETDTLIRHEVGLCAGKRRIDVALINGELSGYEIKSDEDRLTRLAGQADAYGKVLDRATVVTTARHLEGALNALPSWWGVIMASTEAGAVSLEMIREPRVNQEIDKFSLAQMLWREEALEELRLRSLGRGLAKKARYYVWYALSEALPIDELRSVVRSRLKARPDWPGGHLRALDDATSHTTATP